MHTQITAPAFSNWSISLATHYVVAACLCLLVASCDGQKQDVERGEELSPAVFGGDGATVQVSQPQTVTTGSAGTTILVESCTTEQLPLPVFDIVPVTMIFTASSGIAGWSYGAGGVSADNDFPFNGPVAAMGSPVLNGQVGFEFNFVYPANNFQFSEAHVVIDTSRDTSDTEGIFVDGVLSGVPPADAVNTLSPHLTDPLYSTAKGALGGTNENAYYNDFSLSHYKNGELNSFDLLLEDLLDPSDKTSKDVLSDGNLKVVLADDSPAQQANLVIRGLTISSAALECETSGSISFENVYLHNDGNTTGDVAFTGVITEPYTSWTNVGSYDGFEMNFDAPLPKAELEDISLTEAHLRVTAKKVTTGVAAIVFNGVGISTTGFDRDTATASVEEWNDAATAAFDTFMASVSTAAAGTQVLLDLDALYGSDAVRELLGQGKLNVAVAGDLFFQSQNVTTARAIGTQVTGPELILNGSYTVEVCDIPNDPESPLSENGFTAPEPEYTEVCTMVSEELAGNQSTTVLNDGAGPVIGTVQVLDIGSTSATIVWATDEGSTSQALYGIGNTETASTQDTALTTFHQVQLEGLSPYKFYELQVVSEDKFGNRSSSAVQVFRTLR